MAPSTLLDPSLPCARRCPARPAYGSASSSACVSWKGIALSSEIMRSALGWLAPSITTSAGADSRYRHVSIFDMLLIFFDFMVPGGGTNMLFLCVPVCIVNLLSTLLN